MSRKDPHMSRKDPHMSRKCWGAGFGEGRGGEGCMGAFVVWMSEWVGRSKNGAWRWWWWEWCRMVRGWWWWWVAAATAAPQPLKHHVA